MHGLLIRFAVIGLAACALLGSTSQTQAHVDILLYQQDGSLRAGGFDFGGTPPALPEYRTFANTMLGILATPGYRYTGSPGWNALSLPTQLPAGAAVLPGTSQVTVDGPVLPASLSGRNLAHWDGVSPMAFGPVPGGEVLLHRRLSSTGSGFTVFDGGATASPALPLFSTSVSGGVHYHPNYELYGNASLDPFSTDAPTAGIYLASFRASMAGLGSAEPVYALFSVDMPDDTALLQAQSFVAATIPEPVGVASVGVSAALALLARRRRSIAG